MFVSTHSRPKAAGLLPLVTNSTVKVSTHSRPKAAGGVFCMKKMIWRSFNTQPPEGGWFCPFRIIIIRVSTHSRPKAAGFFSAFYFFGRRFQHTAARRRLAPLSTKSAFHFMFQHTAARRRLEVRHSHKAVTKIVSTHSRPKAAGAGVWAGFDVGFVSTHSRPKAAGNRHGADGRGRVVSTHSRPKAAGCSAIGWARSSGCFNTQPPEGGWGKAANS